MISSSVPLSGSKINNLPDKSCCCCCRQHADTRPAAYAHGRHTCRRKPNAKHNKRTGFADTRYIDGSLTASFFACNGPGPREAAQNGRVTRRGRAAHGQRMRPFGYTRIGRARRVEMEMTHFDRPSSQFASATGDERLQDSTSSDDPLPAGRMHSRVACH